MGSRGTRYSTVTFSSRMTVAPSDRGADNEDGDNAEGSVRSIVAGGFGGSLRMASDAVGKLIRLSRKTPPTDDERHQSRARRRRQRLRPGHPAGVERRAEYL